TFLTRCCDDHGYGMVAFDKDYIQIARIFTQDKNGIIESIPCCTTGKRLEEIKKDLSNDIITAAEQGNAIAQNKLGFCYDNGKGVPKNYDEAAKWYRIAAEQGNAYAQFNLGVCYYNGKGVPKSYEDAAKWFRKAA